VVLVQPLRFCVKEPPETVTFGVFEAIKLTDPVPTYDANSLVDKGMVTAGGFDPAPMRDFGVKMNVWVAPAAKL